LRIIPVFEMDYSFSKTEDEGAQLRTLLNLQDRNSGEATSIPVGTKGPDPYSVTASVMFLNKFGYNEIILLTDPEPSIVALGEAIKRKREFPTELRRTPKESHESLGHVERRVDVINGASKAIKLQLDDRVGAKFSSSNEIVAWIQRHASWVISRYMPYQKGDTTFFRRTGKPYTGKTVELGKRF